MNFDELTDEQKAQAKACKTTEDIVRLAKESGVELSDAELDPSLEAAGSATSAKATSECISEASPAAAIIASAAAKPQPTPLQLSPAALLHHTEALLSLSHQLASQPKSPRLNVLVVPMFALSRMGGPWSRAQAIAVALQQAGHRAVLAMADDGNCANPCVPDTIRLPTPSPLGLPMAVASRTFPMAERLGISGRKPVRSFEEVLWLTGALAHSYERDSVSALCDAIVSLHIDAIYSEFSLPAIITAHALDIPAFGSFSFTTRKAFASDAGKAGGVRKLLHEIGLPKVESSLELFDWLSLRFVPSCRELEPIEDANTEFVGFLREVPEPSNRDRDCILVYLGAGSVPQHRVASVTAAALRDLGCDVYVAGCAQEHCEGNLHFAPRFEFAELLPRARCFIHHGGQNSTMDALAYAVPQVIVPGRVFERIYNAKSVERTGAGVRLQSFEANTLRRACQLVTHEPSFAEASRTLRQKLAACGGAVHIVSSIEQALAR